MATHGLEARPFALAIEGLDPVRRRLLRLAGPLLERALGLSRLNELYAVAGGARDTRAFADRALETLGVSLRPSHGGSAAIPERGPLIVVANHPFGGLDGLILLALLGAARGDVKLLANHLLGRIPDLADSLFLVDAFGGSDAARRNVRALRAAARWVQDGGALGVFPAGEVSHLDLASRTVTDPEWSATVGRLVQMTRAPVLTVHFDGRNSLLFQVLGMLHPRLRTALLPRELLGKRHTMVTTQVGSLIPFRRLERFTASSELTAYLRSRTYLLSGRGSRDSEPNALPLATRLRLVRPIADPLPSADVAAEIDALSPNRVLSASRELATYCVRGHEVDAVLQEIGRLRELAFRAVGEGTGRDRDLDRFDRHYVHLFVWHRERREIVGGYRMGLVDEILRRMGPSGLYTTTLFRFKPRLLDQLDAAIELGRSFVRTEYQRDYAPLMLLWKAIGRFVVEHPRYRLLFGPVSISNEYQSLSKYLMMVFLQATRYRPSLGRLIEPRRSPRLPFFRDWDPARTGRIVRDLDEVDELLRDIESNRRAVPTLLRQYLKLNARLLAFSRDPTFSDVVDSLMLVDLAEVDREILLRYMGREGVERYLAHHAAASDRPGPTPAIPAARNRAPA
jgi:putative hemolysin